jgi:tetratricopeptide (TPR) repeat protein
VNHFEAALERVPTATSLHYSLAMAYRGLGRLDSAQIHLQKRGTSAIRVGDPIVDSLQALVRGERGLVMLGRRAYDGGAYQEAADAFARAADAAPLSATPRVNLGLARMQLGDTSGAVEQFEAALRLEPGNQVAHASLGGILVGQRKDWDALPHLVAALDQSPDDANLGRQLVGTLTRLGRPGEAIAVLERMGAGDGDNEDALLGMVLLLSEQGRYRDALEKLDAANRRYPERSATATTLARVLASAPDRALRDGRRALDLATKVHAADQAAVHAETVAMSLAELGRCEEARAWMTKAITAAETAQDADDVSRLKGLVPQYDGASCAPPGR